MNDREGEGGRRRGDLQGWTEARHAPQKLNDGVCVSANERDVDLLGVDVLKEGLYEV